MSSVKGKLARWLSGMMLERGTVVEVREVGGFQRLVVRCGARGFAAGTKVQVLLPSDDMRTYTPIPDAEGMTLLGWKHAGGPAARWLASVRAGDEVPFLGPQRSLELEAGPAVIVGDETSVAVAAALASERPGLAHAILQSAASDDVRLAGESVGLRGIEVVPRADTRATVDAVLAKLAIAPDARVALTGGSELVVGVRDALRRAGVKSVRTKTYWIPGRAGLD